MMGKRPLAALAILSLSALFNSAVAINSDNLPLKKMTDLGLYLTAKEAFATKQAGNSVLFLDVRTRAEVAFLGMPTVADANIPYMLVGDFDRWNDKKGNFKLESNSDFLNLVEDLIKQKGLSKESKIIVMCRSGSRSSKAANLLAKVGYNNVYSVIDGFEGDKAKRGSDKGHRSVNGWKNAGLPWSYKLDKEKMPGAMVD